MDAKISIRPAQPHEVVAVAAIFSAARAQLTFLPRLHSPDEERAFIASCFRTEQIFVATRNETVFGFAACRDHWLNHLYVHPDVQGQGCGDLLLARSKAASQGFLQLWCFARNTRARRFYACRGFTAAEFTDGSRNEERLPDIRYVWHAPQGGTMASSLAPRAL
jgi:GNAT superfamily N-acetyltransferase